MAHTILIVDDEPNFLESIRRLLRKETYTIRCAKSAAEALDILRKEPIDLVVTDQEMPGMRGTEFLREVREAYPDAVRFMLTGKATLEVAVEAINEGAIGRFLTKPCNPVDLAVTIRLALQNKDLLAEAKRLLTKVRQQDRLLDEMERIAPGISEVKRDREGVIIVDEVSEDYESLMCEIRESLGDEHE